MEPVAVVGLALKFPQDATSLDTFWNMLVEKRCAMTDFPSSRLNVDAFYHPDISQRGTLPLRGGHFIKEDLGAFDTKFFSIAPTEAAAMDPAQRGLLETAYRAFENAGISLERASGSNTSVHTGCFTDDYKLQLLKDPDQIPKYAATGASLAMLANRLSWFFNLTGPSMNIDSACSSSGIALDHGCQLLRSKECDMSLVAGCNITFVSDYTSILTKMGFLSPDSRCYTFDKRANGYARGEGIGVLVLKRLSDALRDRNTIRAVIRSSGSNQDAHTPGITQPSSRAQENLIRETYRKAGLSMEHTRFVEAHGTGTKIGDTIETAAIGNAFRRSRSSKDPLFVGAVKSNIGHLEGASGLAGIIKAILVLETGIIVPNTNFESLNERIDTEYLRLSLPLECTPWPTDGLRRISVNSFGFGGSNSHVILDDAFNYLRTEELPGIHCTACTPPRNLDPKRRPKIRYNYQELLIQGPEREAPVGALETPKLLVISAADEGGLARIAAQYQDYLSKKSEAAINHIDYIHNLAYTLDSCRSALLWRSHMILDSLSDVNRLTQRLSPPVARRANPPRLGFVFTGQGAQWHAMGQELLQFPVYAESVERANVFLGSLGCSWSARDELTKCKAESNVDDPAYGQTLCTVLQVALVDLLHSIRIVASAVIGHSSGEIAAAYCAGAISCESAWKIAYYRGQMAALVRQKSCLSGSMISVGLSAEDVIPYISRLKRTETPFNSKISCFNSNRNVTISGPTQQIDSLGAILEDDGIFARKLRVQVAYHSKQMDHVAEEYSALMGDLSLGNTKLTVPMVSSVTEQMADPRQLSKSEYWVTNMVSPVRFSGAMQALCWKDETSLTKKIDGSHRNAIVVDHLIEIGPHAALRAPIRDCLGESWRGDKIGYSSTLQRNKSASDTFLDLAGHLYGLGISVDIRSINDPHPRSRDSRITLVDLPEYPFDHSSSYWHESRISSDYRLRHYGPVELLGSPSPNWNSLDAQWRNLIHSIDVPWAEDHKISGVPLCPGAGMIVMAIEAVSQLADPEKDIIGYALRDIEFGVALDLSPGPSNTETRFALRSLKSSPGQNCLWYSFSIYSLKNESWTEHCTGKIQHQYKPHDKIEIKKLQAAVEDYKGLWWSKRKHCTTPVESDAIYEFLRQRGIDYGPTFRRLEKLRSSNNGEIAAEVSLLKLASDRLAKLQVIHPATLDAVMHSVFAAQSKGGTEDIDTQVPTAIRNMWISREGLAGQSEDSIMVTTIIDARTPSMSKSSSIALNKEANKLRISIEGLEMSRVAESTSTIRIRPGDHQVWSKMRLSIDAGSLTNDQVSDWLSQSCSATEPEPVAFYQELRVFLKSVLHTTRANLQSSSPRLPQPHLHKYVEWIDSQLKNGPSSGAQQLPSSKIKEIDNRLRNEGPVGLLFSKIAENLDGILQGSTDALRVLFEDNLVEDYYTASSKSSICFKRLQNFLEAIALKRPSMRIMEIGAGTGVFTNMVLDAISVRDESSLLATMCDHYSFTDISPSFFDNAQTKFSEHSHKMSFCMFDLEKDIVLQGQQETSYDIVIAANVLHIGKNLMNSLQSIRRLLKPGGKLILHETTTPSDITTGFVFGLLQDWWVSAETNRQMSPLLTECDWHLLLKQSGFSGADIMLRDFESEDCHQSAIMISTAIDKPHAITSLPSTEIIINRSSHAQQLLAGELQERLRRCHECEASISSFQEIVQRPHHGAVQVFLTDTEYPILPELDSSIFRNLKSSLQRASQILWTTSGGGRSIENPGFGMIDGFARSLRLENNNIQFVTLALDPATADIGRKVDHIIQVMFQSFLPAIGSTYEREYVEVLGALHLRRLEPVTSLKNDISERLHGSQVRAQNLEESKPFQIKVSKPGQLDSIDFIARAKTAAENLGRDEIEIDVKAIGFATTDLMQASGSTEQIELGAECAGTVCQTSLSDPSAFQVGDRVCVLGANLCQSHVRITSDHVALIPDDVKFEQAAVLPFRSWLASYLINEVSRLARGESIFIHGGAESLGQLCIRFAQEVEATIYVTTSSEEERCMLRDKFALPEDRIFLNHAVLNWPSTVDLKERCDTVLSVSENADHSSICKNLKPFGRYVHLTEIKDAFGVKDLPSDLPRNITVNIVDSLALSQAYLGRVHRPLSGIIDHAGRVLVDLQDIKSYSASDTAKALRQLKDLNQRTRVIVRMDKDDTILLTQSVKPSYNFDPNSTYMVSGGFGGIGRCVARWMVSRGAVNLLLLSRSGPSTEAARHMVAEMTAQGVRVETPSCDAADLVALETTLSKYSNVLPPIKGCIQASGAIQDTWFEKMTFEDWTAVTKPKVQASWNLHAALPKGMDFFVLTASISGIMGQITQVNYSSGNTYQDALANFRISQGEKAVSLDLGLLLIDGLLKDKPELVERLNNTGYFIPLSEPEIIAIFDHYCDPSLQLVSSNDAQPIVGIQSPAVLRAQGIQLPQSMHEPFWSVMNCAGDNSTSVVETKDQDTDLAAMVSNAASTTEAGTTATEGMMTKVAQLLSMPPETLDADRPVHSYGVDSLTAVDIRNWISKTFAVQMSTFEIMGDTTFNAMGLSISKKCKQAQEA